MSQAFACPSLHVAIQLHVPLPAEKQVPSDEAFEPPGHVEPLLVLRLRLVQCGAAAQGQGDEGCQEWVSMDVGGMPPCALRSEVWPWQAADQQTIIAWACSSQVLAS